MYGTLLGPAGGSHLDTASQERVFAVLVISDRERRASAIWSLAGLQGLQAFEARMGGFGVGRAAEVGAAWRVLLRYFIIELRTHVASSQCPGA